jgi:hypothetical protein
MNSGKTELFFHGKKLTSNLRRRQPLGRLSFEIMCTHK